MDALAELEAIARDIDYHDVSEDCSELDVVHQYMDLFGLNEQEARTKVHEFYGLMPKGDLKPKPKPKSADAYLVMLQTNLPDAGTVKVIAGLTEDPETVIGTDDLGREATFCRIDNRTRSAIVAYFIDNNLGNAPTFFQLTLAEKSLDGNSWAPALGLDAMLPQNRLDSQQMVVRPTQNDYPVWYFFYGPLANAAELSIILRLSDEPQYKPATLSGGCLLAWNAIVDADPHQVPTDIRGQAFLVTTKRQEESLRFSVTDKFEVVRCRFCIDDNSKLIALSSSIFGVHAHDINLVCIMRQYLHSARCSRSKVNLPKQSTSSASRNRPSIPPIINRAFEIRDRFWT